MNTNLLTMSKVLDRVQEVIKEAKADKKTDDIGILVRKVVKTWTPDEITTLLFEVRGYGELLGGKFKTSQLTPRKKSADEYELRYVVVVVFWNVVRDLVEMELRNKC